MFKCKYCGNDSYLIKQLMGASSPNVLGLYCKKCGKWQKWLNKKERKLYTTHTSADSSSTAVNPCLYCGDELPEGMQVCYSCEKRLCSELPEEKKLRWICNQIVDELGDSNEEKMLKCIKLYCKIGADKISKLAKENADIKQRIVSSSTFKASIEENVKKEVKYVVDCIRYAPWNIVGELKKMTAEEYADKLEIELSRICKQYGIKEINPLYVYDEDLPF